MTLMFTLTLKLLFLRGTRTQSVTQPDVHITVDEGDPLEVRCIYTSSVPPYLFWYVQYPNQELQLLLKYVSTENIVSGIKGFEAEFRKTDTSFHLRKSSAHRSDSAQYFCAASHRFCGGSSYKLTFGKGTVLTVNPNIKDPKPAVYQLTKSKSSNKTVCLVTDFSSDKNILKNTDVLVTNTTVLDMKSTESKSNGILAWDDTASFSCRDTFNVTFYSSSGLPCNAALVQENFRTDWNLNYQNLLVITFRILFLKVTGFNLLMTLRLWSC
ncbi:T cell receptor alpha chain MC.7.G5-like [Sorex araneus]|uniref:T cell receptor alpha chain MC.7.G5-like n=1 Tax=Sorex araneus TaxID=42254 RepID=UPI002433780B|nr:T cell receptor alpha chain MC.7.G5-like [Sorex araneus]